MWKKEKFIAEITFLRMRVDKLFVSILSFSKDDLGFSKDKRSSFYFNESK